MRFINLFARILTAILVSPNAWAKIYSYTYSETEREVTACQHFAPGETLEEWQANVIKYGTDSKWTCSAVENTNNKVTCKSKEEEIYFTVGENTKESCIEGWKQSAKVIEKLRGNKTQNANCKFLQGFNVKRRISENEYLIEAQTGVESVCRKKNKKRGNCTSFKYEPVYEDALLITTKTKITDVGKGSLHTSKTGRKKITLENGFTKEVQVFTEDGKCKPQSDTPKYTDFKFSFFVQCGTVTKNITDADSVARSLGSKILEESDKRLVIKTDMNVIPRYFYKTKEDCLEDSTRKK